MIYSKRKGRELSIRIIIGIRSTVNANEEGLKTMNFFIHIGFPKTGTTTLQNCMAYNRQQLIRECGVLYPFSCGPIMHFKLFLYLQEHESDANIFHRLTGENLIDLKQNFKNAFADEIARIQPKTVLLSSEYFPQLTAKEISAFKELIAPYARSVKIIAYLRRQDTYVLSMYSTMVKSGYDKPISEFKNIVSDNYLEILDSWSAVFGIENVLAYPYIKGTLANFNIISDFMDKINVPLSSISHRPKNRNSRLTSDAIHFLRNFNKHLPAQVDGRLNLFRHNIVNILERLKGEESMPLAVTLPAHKVKQYRSDIKKISEKYTNGNTNSFSLLGDIDEGSHRNIHQEELSIDRTYQIFSFLWVELYKDLKSKQLTQMGKAHLLQKQYADARLCLEKSLELDDTNSSTHYNLAVLDHLMGNISSAICSVQRAIKIDPSCARYHKLLIQLHNVNGDSKAAENALNVLYDLQLIYGHGSDVENLTYRGKIKDDLE